MSKQFTKSAFFREKIHPILAKLPLYDYLLLRKKSYLKSTGWFRSFRSGKSIDLDGKPLPWMTYAAISLMDERLPADALVFEYGSGLGTHWWAKRAKKVVAVEHSLNWIDKIKPEIPENVELLYRELDAGYAESVSEQDNLYDLLIIDGQIRLECCRYSVKKISERGVIIFDDSERKKHRESLEFLKQNGFRQLRLPGFSPIEFMECETSIFYRDGNLLGL